MNELIKPHKYNLGITGNCSFLAYIGMKADVQWMCMPRFDSSFVFGSLLDKNKGGEFSITPDDGNWSSRQYYMRNTNILCTEFETSGSRFRVVDFAPRFYNYGRYFRPLTLMRKVELLSGEPVIKVICRPAGDYGSTIPDITMGSNHIQFLNLPTMVRLTTDIPVNYVLEHKPFLMEKSCYMAFTWGPPLEAPLKETSESFLEKTREYWLGWVKNTSIPGIFQQEVIRSALVLKLHQYEDTGAIIASGTTSLPEFDGSGRNWDYRYCWLRDAYFTLSAFNNIGHFEELEKYFHFIQTIALGAGDELQPLYSITGETDLRESEILLDGYMGNKPVRTGNAAISQKQYDVYGLLLACLAPLFIDKRLDIEFHSRRMGLVWKLLGLIEKVLNEPDAGIWELRGKTHRHCYTALCHWVGANAALTIGKVAGVSELADKASSIIAMASEAIESCWNQNLRVYTQARDVMDVDASSLQLVLFRYLDPMSLRAKQHVSVLESQLKTPGGLFHRYVCNDDFGKPGTAFLVCSFWYAETLACFGKTDEAVRVIETLLKSSNHLGLFSEDVDDVGGQWGNFPQTYSHVGLMNAVYRISRKRDMPFFIS
jgi:glucoamylase